MSHAEWDELAQLSLKTIRAVDRQRMVIVAALNSEEPAELRPLDLPGEDRRIILTAHYYKPFEFTHQGAPWIPNGPRAPVPWGSETDRAVLAEDIAAIDRWARSQGRPLYLGEFGVYDAAALKDRAGYMSAVARAAEGKGWAWAVWQFDHDFAVFSSDRDAWNAPLLRALIP
jgi:endoglucanase